MSLLLRPLRLVVSAEALRHLRILTLKVLHLPHVSLILAYETGRLYWSDHRRAKSSSGARARNSHVSTSLRQPILGKSMHNSSRRSRPDVPRLDQQARTIRSPVITPVRGARAAAVDGVDKIELAIGNLQTQVETLTRWIAGMQEGHGDGRMSSSEADAGRAHPTPQKIGDNTERLREGKEP